MGSEDRQELEGPDRALESEDYELEGGFDVDEYVDPDPNGAGERVDAGYFGDELDSEDDVGEAELPVEGPEPADAEADKPSPSVVLESVRLRLAAFWATVISQARWVELPGAPEGRLRRLATVAGISLACLLAGTGAFLLAKGSGEDVEQARLEGAAAGRQAGAIEGAAQGYPAGFRQGRGKGFRDAYTPAYQLNYKRAFEQAGLDVPTNQQFDVPLP